MAKKAEEEDEEDPLNFVEPGENWEVKEEENEIENNDVKVEAQIADEPKKEQEPEDFDIDVPDAKEESVNETPITVKECKEEIAPKERDVRIRKSINREKVSAAKEEPIQNREAIIERMKQQNSKLKKEFAQLKGKLEECIAKAKQGYKSMNERPPITEEDMSTYYIHNSSRTCDEGNRTEGVVLQEADTGHEEAACRVAEHCEVGLSVYFRIVALENEERAKKKILQELESEKQSLLKIQKEQKKAMDVMINEKDLKKKRDQLREELRAKKNEYKEKQNLLRKQEKQMKEQHETYISLEEKCRKLQGLINEKKAGITPDHTKAVTEDDVNKLEDSIKNLERIQAEEKRKYKQMITTQENKIKELNAQLDTLSLELKQKDQECKLNSLKIKELKRQIRLGVAKPAESAQVDQNIAKGVEQIKRDMQAEKAGNSSGTPVQPWENAHSKDAAEAEDEKGDAEASVKPTVQNAQSNEAERKEEVPT
eukprot:TRINITY_DN7988_c0_g2_i4.p1 TRINITY_DN7988_c0_g2~~TRINITY_DN7988_c0_g2_i4.p1  ORF type:complete len:483 (-),score=190.78 TRINITY_DN7988_c0_g2_i4:238-1686(-)